MVACLCAIGLVGVAAAALAAPTVTTLPTAAELAARDAWVKQHFSVPRAAAPSPAPAAAASVGLLTLANHGPILRNGRPDGRLLKLAGTEYAHGLICHAPSKVVVLLPRPGARFSATAGVDANAGGGTVEFVVRLGAREVFRSGVLRGGGPGVPVSVDLEGARQFTLEAGDAGDGIACDHADWADATVTLAGGEKVNLSDLPDVSFAPAPRTAASPPFSFRLGGAPSDSLLPSWRHVQKVERLDRRRTRRTHTYTDPRTGLEVRCVAVVYADYPTVEWTAYVRNTGTADSPVVEALQALDLPFEASPAGPLTLHRAVGSPCQANDYQPIAESLPAGARVRVSAAGGRPTNSDLCYFDLEWQGRGALVAIGWPGQWAATFDRDRAHGLRVTAGQELTHLVLHAGEEVRTPLVALQFWQDGDTARAQNMWRRWMVAHNLPRPGGKLVPTHYGGCFGNPLPVAAEETAQFDALRRDAGTLDYWFIDAGWYPCSGSWTNVGTWEPDPQRFPRGLRQVAEHVHAQGARFVVWFEPERVAAGSWLAGNHPEWVLGGKAGGLLNLGDPAARAWITERVDTLLREGGIDVYRTDFNIDPLSYWQSHDEPDRLGITENAYVRGLLALWDHLLARHPDLYIDTCASGGRRNDLETLRRAVPLLRSDWAVLSFNAAGAIGQQCQTYGIASWMPYHGTGAPSGDPYVMRSSYVPAYRVGWNAEDSNRDVPLLRRTVAEFRRLEPYLLGDFWPLTPYSLEKTAWIAWQYDRPEQGEGAVQAFRREECADASARLRLRGLEASATYAVESLDGVPLRRAAGRELMEQGLLVDISARPGSALLFYRRER